MSHQRNAPSDAGREPHSVSLKVLRLSRPSLSTQYPLPLPLSRTSESYAPASLAYSSSADTDTNPQPFILSPVLNLPPSFGSAYVGETFSCTLCANQDVPNAAAASGSSKVIKDVRIDAEMKTPSSATPVKLDLGSRTKSSAAPGGVDLSMGETLQEIVHFDLKEEGNHVLAVTVSYYEATDTSGRTRTFRKLYQFICKSSLIVRTKAGAMPSSKRVGAGQRWVLEAQIENCSEDAVRLERVHLDLEPGLRYEDCNWGANGSEKPTLQPGEVEQICFVAEQMGSPWAGAAGGEGEEGGRGAGTSSTGPEGREGRLIFGVLSVVWRGENGNSGSLSTGKLGVKAA